MPVLAQRVEGGGKPDRTQDVLSVHAENPSMSASGGQDVKITVQVDGAMPVLAQRVEGGGKPDRTQDVLSVHAENPSMSASGGQDVKITVQVDGEAREMLLEDYVAGVVAAEISPSFPEEALKAQAVAARTYAAYKQRTGRPEAHPDADVCDDYHHCAAYIDSFPEEALKAQAVAARTYAAYKQRTGRPEAHPDADVCDDYHHCAAYIDLAAEASGRWGSEAETCENAILSAVRATAGEVVTYEGEPIIAVFCAASGEKTESSADVWGSEVPYLQTVDSPGGEACPKYKGEVRFTAKEFREKISKALPSADLTGAPGTWFKASTRTAAGGVKTVRLGGVQVTGVDLRETLGLNSTNFTIKADADSITFQTTGYGHGVGLSQYGAKYLAEQGKGYQEILTHYYTGTTVEPWAGN